MSQTRYETHTCLIQVTVTLQRLQLLNQLFSLAYFVINLTLQVRVRLWTDKNIRKHQTTHASPNIASRPRSLCLRDVLRLFTFNIMPLRSIFLVNTNFTAIKAIFVMHAVLIRVRTAAIEANVTCLNKGLRKGRTYSYEAETQKYTNYTDAQIGWEGETWKHEELVGNFWVRWRSLRLFTDVSFIEIFLPIPVAARSNARVCGRSLAGIAGSNPPEGVGCLSIVSVVR